MPDILITENGDLLDYLETGISFLISIIKDNLLNLIMSDLYSPSFGTDLKLWPSSNMTNKKELELKMTLYIQGVAQRIITEQIETPSADDAEMLESLELISLTEEISTKNSRKFWLAKILVTTINGETEVLEKRV